MGFGSLLGNDRLKEQLHNAFAHGRASHFYLISGPEGSGKRTLSRLLAAAFLCQGEHKPCGTCPACRKVLGGVHPDFITVEDPEHKNVAVRIIRQVRDDLFIRPNEGSHKIYFLPQSLGVEGQNALLKVLEEPPAYGVFLLLTENPETILPTVRSRCVQLQLKPLSPALLKQTLEREFPQAAGAVLDGAIARSGGYLGQARHLLQEGEQTSPQTEAFVQAMAQRDQLLLVQTLAQMERWKREALIEQLQQWLALLEGALACRCGMPAASELSGRIGAAKSARELSDAISALQQALQYAQSNVSPGAICGHLAHTL